jgi:hypothetical protein
MLHHSERQHLRSVHRRSKDVTDVSENARITVQKHIGAKHKTKLFLQEELLKVSTL